MNPEIPSLVLFIILSVLLLLMPYLLFPSIPFGVRIPLSYAEDQAVISERKRYVIRMLLLEIILFAIQMVLPYLTRRKELAAFSIVALAIFSWIIYYISHRRLVQIKLENNWYENKHQVIAANARPRSYKPSGLFWLLLILPTLVLIGTVCICLCTYSNMPETLRYVFNGSLGNWTLTKSPLHALLPVIFQFGFTIILAGFAWLRIFGSQPVEIEDPEQDEQYQKTNIQIVQILLLSLAFGFNCAFLMSALSGWGIVQSTGSFTDLFTLGPIVICLIIAPILLLGLRSHQRIPSADSRKVSLDDDRYWKLGVFYFNRQDPSLMVNKRFGIGRTLNFGNPLTWVLLAGLIIFILIRTAG
jgi:uncharacterized membrane protein